MTQKKLLPALFAEMDRRGMTQAELGRRTGISQAALSCWRNGTRKPHIDKVFAILDALDLELRVGRKKTQE